MSFALRISQQYDNTAGKHFHCVAKWSGTQSPSSSQSDYNFSNWFMLSWSIFIFFSRAVNLDISQTEFDSSSLVEGKYPKTDSSSLSHPPRTSTLSLLLQFTSRTHIGVSPCSISHRLNWVERFSGTSCSGYRTHTEVSNVVAILYENIWTNPTKYFPLLSNFSFYMTIFSFCRRHHFYSFHIVNISELLKFHRILSGSYFIFKSHWSEEYTLFNVCSPQLRLQYF